MHKYVYMSMQRNELLSQQDTNMYSGLFLYMNTGTCITKFDHKAVLSLVPYLRFPLYFIAFATYM